jgi:FAD dependent oxidoreductase TIGR03364
LLELAGAEVARLVIVGAGIVGTALAVAAVDQGHEVVQIERDAEPRGATVRSFGLLWISGRAPGRELDVALASRERWIELAGRAPGIGLRECGSLLLARGREEAALIEQACARPDAAARGLSIVTAAEARRLNPALAGTFACALHCALDAVVEPRRILPALRGLAEASGRYAFLPGRTVVEADGPLVRDHLGCVHEGDVALICTGAWLELYGADRIAAAQLRTIRLQMAETAPVAAPFTTAVANADSMRYYPGFALPARELLPEPDPAVARFEAQLLLAPRRDGAITIGDTHAFDEPGAFGSEDEAHVYLAREAALALGAPAPAIARRWEGAYLRRCDGADWVWRDEIRPGVVAVAGTGGMGVTGSQQLAWETLDALDL